MTKHLLFLSIILNCVFLNCSDRPSEASHSKLLVKDQNATDDLKCDLINKQSEEEIIKLLRMRNLDEVKKRLHLGFTFSPTVVNFALKIDDKSMRSEIVNKLLETTRPTAINLQQAILQEDTDLITNILNRLTKHEIEQWRIGRRSLITFAATENLTEIVRLMLEKGISPNDDDDREPPILYAVRNSNLELVRLLLNFGAKVTGFHGSINMRTYIAYRKIHHSTDQDLCQIEKLIYDRREQEINDYISSIKQNTLSSEKILKLLKDDDTDLTIKIIEIPDILIVAIKNGYKIDVLDLLIRRGANINYEEEGESPLSIAISDNNLELLQLLMKNASIFTPIVKEAIKQNQNEASDYVVKSKNSAIETYIKNSQINNLATVDDVSLQSFRSEKDLNALQLAASNASIETFEKILSICTNQVNSLDVYGNTILMLAAKNLNIETFFKTLFLCDIDIKNNLGKTVLDLIFERITNQTPLLATVLQYSILKNNTELFNMVIKRGQEINNLIFINKTVVDRKMEIVTFAALLNRVEFVNKMIELGVNVNIAEIQMVENENLKNQLLEYCNKRETLISALSSNYDCKTIELLIRENPHLINVRSKFGSSLIQLILDDIKLYFPIKQLEKIKLLISFGAKVDNETINQAETLKVIDKDNLNKAIELLKRRNSENKQATSSNNDN